VPGLLLLPPLQDQVVRGPRQGGPGPLCVK
jgi:hypothetical protein